MNGHLLASCLRNIFTKNYKNLIILLKVTIENVWDVFGTQCTAMHYEVCMLFHLTFTTCTISTERRFNIRPYL